MKPSPAMLGPKFGPTVFAPRYVDWYALVVVGKSEDLVAPTTIAFPLLSTAIPAAKSFNWPPRYVAYNSWLPAGFSFATQASLGL